MNPSRIRQVYEVLGVVQGVGFRPALFRLAGEARLGGWVQNRAGSVRLALEGPPAAVRRFVEDLPRRLPPNARVESLRLLEECALAEAAPRTPFTIRESGGGESVAVTIPADLAVCGDCLRELQDPRDRRYGYAFTTCTNCGPRYTVTEDMPYDRARTTLARFSLCGDCDREYRDPRDRRFHAESIACPKCGPRLRLEDLRGREVPGPPLREARRLLAEGSILAVRGIGGFLLAADAFHRAALRTLRERKRRPHKPFAVMARTLEVAERYCPIPDPAAALLRSAEAPIVILDRHLAAGAPPLPFDLIAPDSDTLGVMLPTSPLHWLLAHPLADDPTPAFDVLIMTSGNRGGEPICITPAEARERLGGIADFMLTHDREINLRNDDSLCVLQAGAPQIWRRARGYAPGSVGLAQPLRRTVLAMGAELKNAVALGFESGVVLSPHVGDLETPEAVAGLEQVARALPRWLGRPPEAVAVDLHPDMQSTRLGRRLAQEQGIPVVEVQHHHAHAAACLAEHGVSEGLVLAFDGTGLGTDDTVWGAELLHVTPEGYRRLATFAGAPLPGGDAAVRQPARQVIGRWAAAGIEAGAAWAGRLGLRDEQIQTWIQQSRQGLLAPLTHAAGRLFDAVSVCLGVAPETVTYEGQSAIRLEAAARRSKATALPHLPFAPREKGGILEIDWTPTFARFHNSPPRADEAPDLALAAHHAVVEAALAMVEYGRQQGGPAVVGLSGGVFMNRILNALLAPALEQRGVRVLIHRQTPPNDGCIALGQAVIAGRSEPAEAAKPGV